MKKYHVYGIGNALVDLDFEVCNATLERLHIDKGVMTLIDEDRHHYLLEELDGVKHLKACGGSAANTLFTLQQMGAATFYSCKIGHDEAGEFYHQDLVAQGIHTNLNACERDGVTGKCIVLVTPDADRTMNTYLGATSSFSTKQLSENDLANSEYLYIEGYLVASPTAREAAILARKMAKQHKVKTAISLSDPNMVTYFKHGLCDIIGDKVDILFCNEDEAKLFTEANELEQATEKLKQYADTFVITLGSRGALVFNGTRISHVPSYETKVVDTVGAGDVFAGAFLYALTHGLDYSFASGFANFAASKVVAKFGPRLSIEEINDVTAMLKEQVKSA
jgi:sugar/nucleoside kinase (ribokinase family)